MTTEDEVPAAGAKEPIATVVAAMSGAATALPDGTCSSCVRAQQALPGTTLFLSRIAYTSGYYLSYGVFFPTLFFLHLIPGVQSVASGFVDGAVAARNYVQGLQEPDSAQPGPATESQIDRSAPVPA